MNQAINGRDAHHVVGKDAVPCAKGLVSISYLEYERSELLPSNTYYVDFDRPKGGQFHIKVISSDPLS